MTADDRRRLDEVAATVGRAMPAAGPIPTTGPDRCRDCKQTRELTRPLMICRECAAKRDRAAGLTVDDQAWK